VFWSLDTWNRTVDALAALENQLVWRSEDGEVKTHPRVAAIWSKEDSGASGEAISNQKGRKDLNFLWDQLENAGWARHGPLDTVVVDDEREYYVSQYCLLV
jgi:hypothetical protein